MATTTDTCPVCEAGIVTIEAEPVLIEGASEPIQRVTDLMCTRGCDPDEIREALRTQGVNLSL